MAEHPGLQKWKELATKQLGKKPLEALNWKTPEGILVKPLYTAEDLEGMPHVNTLPGFAPYVRGPMATMYAGRPWTIRQYAGFATAKNPMSFTGGTLPPGKPGFRWHLILQPTGDMIRIIPGLSVISARPVWLWTLWKT